MSDPPLLPGRDHRDGGLTEGGDGVSKRQGHRMLSYGPRQEAMTWKNTGDHPRKAGRRGAM